MACAPLPAGSLTGAIALVLRGVCFFEDKINNVQQAGAVALKSPPSYYHQLAAGYRVKRERLLKILSAAGFTVFKPSGAYYIMTDISGLDFARPDRQARGETNDVAFAKFLVEKVGVAVVPGSSFYRNPVDGSSQVRFTFCKQESTLAAAEERLSLLPKHLAAR